MESVKTEEELTSTMGNVLSTSKEEKNDSSDATPTSSTDANTNLKASQTVSDDPISSTSADSFDQSKLGEVNETPDETDKVVSEDHVGDLFGMNVPREKITEDVEDLVHDLESLLGETSEPFTLNNIQRPTGEGDASASGTVVEKTSIDNGERSKREVEDIKTDSSINVTQTVTEKLNLEKDSTRISSPSEQDVSKTSENSKMSFTDKKNESKTSTIEDQNTSDNTIQDHPIDSGVEISTMAEVSQEIESANPSVHDDEGSVGSWELIDASEADNYVSSTPGPSGEPVQAPSLRSTIEDITSSGDKGSPNDDREGEENREAESTEVAGQEVEEQLIESVIDQELFETQKISEEIREAEPVKTEEISIEASTSSEAKIEEMTNNACQNIKSQNILSQTEITSSELCTKSPVEANRKFKQTEVVEIQTHGTEIEETETEIDEPYDLSGLPTKKDPEDREVTYTEFEEDKNKQSLIKSEEYIKEESPTNLKVLDAVTDCKQPKDMTQLEEDNTIIPEQKLDTYSKEEEKSAAESKLVEAKDDAHNISEIRPNEKVVVCTVINRDLDEHLNVQVSKPECSFKSEEKVDQIESLVQNECTSQILQSEENLEQTEKVQQTSNDRKFGEKIDTVEESEEKKSVNIDEMLAVNETITESVLEEGNKTIIESTNISSVFEVTVTESSSDVATESKELDKNLAQTISEDSLKPASIEETMIKKIHKKETTSEKFIDDPVHEVTSKNTISVEIDVPIIIDSEKIMEEKKSIKEILNENSLGDTSKIPITPEKITSESELEGTTKITADNSVENIGKTSTSNENITTENVLEDNTKIVSEGKITADNTVENNSNTSTSDEKITYKSELEDNSKITMPEEKIPKECSVSKSSVNEISEKNDLNEIKECVSDVTKCTEPSVGSDDPPIVIDKELVSDNTDAPVTKDIEKNTDEPKISPQAHCENSTLTLSLQNKDKHKSVLIDEIKTDQKVDCVSATGRKRSQLAELEFAPLQLSEDDSDDSETVPRLALDPDESNSPLIADPAEEVPQMEEAIEAKPLFVQTVVPVIDTSDNLETMLAVASLQSIDIPKPNEMEQVVSEKERREMEALAIAVQSITDNSSSYVEEYVEPTSEHIEADTSGPEVIQEEPVIVREAESSNTVEIGPENILQENESVATRDADETMNASQGEDNNKNIENTITKEQKPLVESEVITVSEHPKESKVDAVESELKVKLLIQEEFKDNVVSNEIKDNETHVQQQDKLQSESKEIVDIRDMEVKSMESKENDENAFVDKKLDETSEKKDENTCHSSENSQDSTSEVFIKESKKSRLNDKPKKHKKADKYDELTINVDVPDREVTYSPKITIKPIKVPDEEVSTTTSGDLDISKGSLKMTITKQSDNMHSILKISDQENSDAISIPDEPIPKLIIKPKMHQIEQQHSPKMSTRSSKQSPTGSSQRSGSPRITIKPLVKPDKPEPVSPIKIKINTKANTKSTTKEEDVTRKVLVKPIKPHEEVEQVHSPRITIKPIPKPDNEKDVNPRLTIKPIKKPDEDIENEDKERSSPKVIIKPIVKPSEDLQTSLEEEELVKERIVLKINKGNLPSPAKESKKREHTTDDDKSEKLAKITVKFSKEGGHPHIVHQLGDETSSKRPNEEIPASAEKNKKQKVETDTLISTRSSARHKEQLEGTDKMSPGPEVKSKHKDLSMESPIETKRPRKDNLNDKSKLLKDENADELLFIETKVDSPIIISEDSRSQDSGSVILLEESKDDTLLLDQVKTPDISKVGVKTALLEGESATPSPVLKRGRGRPRKLPLEVRPEARLPEELSKLKEREVADQPQVPVHESGRPKRSCRGQSVCDTLGIKPRKPRGPGRGRGSKRGMGNRAIAERA